MKNEKETLFEKYSYTIGKYLCFNKDKINKKSRTIDVYNQIMEDEGIVIQDSNLSLKLLNECERLRNAIEIDISMVLEALDLTLEAKQSM